MVYAGEFFRDDVPRLDIVSHDLFLHAPEIRKNIRSVSRNMYDFYETELVPTIKRSIEDYLSKSGYTQNKYSDVPYAMSYVLKESRFREEPVLIDYGSKKYYGHPILNVVIRDASTNVDLVDDIGAIVSSFGDRVMKNGFHRQSDKDAAIYSFCMAVKDTSKPKILGKRIPIN